MSASPRILRNFVNGQYVEPDGDGWKVYQAQRGRERELRRFARYEDAARDAVMRLAR